VRITRLFSVVFSFILPTLLLACAPVRTQEISDPLEPVNRGIFWFNDQVDIYLAEPVARGYDYITPKKVQRSVDNFFENLRYPVRLVSDLIQLKFSQAGVHTGRFCINSTIGVVGLFDIAKDWGLELHHEDFGTALANSGVPYGPYIVIPFLGPSSLRDGLGKIVDLIFLDPLYYIRFTDLDSESQWAIGTGATLLNVVNTRASMLEAVKSAKEASVDYYLFTQSAWFQIRQNQIYDDNPPEVEEQFESLQGE
jgi:phospholipid-binding lipoprotein MlaA